MKNEKVDEKEKRTTLKFVILQGLLFAAVIAWGDLFRNVFETLLPGRTGLLAQVAFALIITGIVVYISSNSL